MSRSPFLVNVSDLLSRSVSSRPETIEGSVDWSVDLTGVEPDPPLRAHLVLHPVSGGIAVTGSVSFTSHEACVRCLATSTTDRQVTVGALFDRSGDEESYPLLGHEIDVEQMLLDEVLLSLPIAHTCGEQCPGLVTSAGMDLNTGSSGDEGDIRSPFAVLKDILDPED